MNMKTLAQRCQAIQLLVLDVDGVLTEGSVTYQAMGSTILEEKRFHVRDGSGLVTWHKRGRHSAIITGRSSPIVEKRASELGIGQVIQGSRDKRVSLEQILSHYGIDTGQVACVGDDTPDLPMLQFCELAVAVADACSEVLNVAHYVTQAPGGRGAVREVIERILRCQGQW